MRRLFCALLAMTLVVGVSTFAIGADKAPKAAVVKKTIEEQFNDMNKANDGNLTLDEYIAGLETKRKLSDKERASAEARFKKWDTDKNGTLSLDEFKAKGKVKTTKAGKN